MKPTDGGPVYAETDFSSFPVEPWNTVSELAVLLVAVYWTRVWRREGELPAVVKLSTLLLYPQWLGATLFHAARNSVWWLLLDIVPILLFGVVIAVWGWGGVFAKGRLTIAASSSVVAAHIAVYALHNLGLLGSSGAYVHLFAHLTVVMYWRVSGSERWQAERWLLIGVVGFGTALLFRELDSIAGEFYGPPGTHFLWHLFAALGAHGVIAACWSVSRGEEARAAN